MSNDKTYLFGPVPSRRLRRSLGVDLVPFKVCTLDCIYCQVGHTTKHILQRGSYTPINEILSELKTALIQGIESDYITISGSGEPTLHSQLGDLIDGIHQLTPIPVAVITNSTLLYREDVRLDCAKADLVLPSLDATDQETFEAINHPCSDLTFDMLIQGLIAFRQNFIGQIWLEIFLVPGMNTSPVHIREFKELLKDIMPDKIQLNTAVRPTAQTDVPCMYPDTMHTIAKQLGDTCEIIAHPTHSSKHHADHLPTTDRILSILQRRPSSIEDICNGLGITRESVQACVTALLKQQLIIADPKNETIFYKVL